MKITLIIGIVAVVLLAGFLLFNETHWTDKYDMEKQIIVFGKTESIGDRIDHERSQIEEHGYQEICIFGMTMMKGLMENPTKDEKLFVEIMENLCNEYR